MDFHGILDKIKEKASSLFEKVREFYEENKMLSLLIASLTVLLLLCILLLIVLTSKKKNSAPEVPGTVLELTETPVVPDGPELPKDYTASRSPKEKWSEEEAEEWFTIPTQKEIDSLSKANDNLINEITGAAP